MLRCVCSERNARVGRWRVSRDVVGGGVGVRGMEGESAVGVGAVVVGRYWWGTHRLLWTKPKHIRTESIPSPSPSPYSWSSQPNRVEVDNAVGEQTADNTPNGDVDGS